MRNSDKPRGRLAQGIDDVREYERIAGFSQIARRALANNAFDGVLTMIGVLMGNYLGDVRSPATVVRIGIATSISIGVSGLWGAYLAESADLRLAQVGERYALQFGQLAPALGRFGQVSAP